MDYLPWIILGVCCFIGLLGVFLPVVPGAALILIGAIVHKLMLPHVLSWWTIGLLAVGVGLSYASDFFGTMAGAKWGGATKWGLTGSVVGLVVGLFFGVFGLILGPLIGAFVAELIFAGREIRDAARAGIGAGFGLAISMLLHLLIAVAMIGMLVLDCLMGGIVPPEEEEPVEVEQANLNSHT